jgi:hypothetical protein
LDTIEDLREDRVVKIEHQDTEGAALFGSQTPCRGVGSVPQLLSSAFNPDATGVTDFG